MSIGRYLWMTLLCGCVVLIGKNSVLAESNQVLDASLGYVSTYAKSGNRDFSKLPLSVEFSVQSNCKNSYNIFIANESKSSPWHWEVFSMPGTGLLSAYLPGFKPDLLRSSVNVIDGAWHKVGLRMEQEKLALLLDGEVVAEAVPGKTPEKLASLSSEGLHVGALSDGSLRCDALIDNVRISSNGEAIASWDFNNPTEQGYKDSTKHQYVLTDYSKLLQEKYKDSCGLYVFLGTSHAHQKIYKMDKKGNITWSFHVQAPQDVWQLEDGNILTTSLHSVQVITPGKKILWRYDVEAPNEIPNCQPLPNGNILVGVVGLCRLIEFDPKGKVVHQIQLTTPVKVAHAQFRMCRKTDAGTYLVPFTTEGAVREYDHEGHVIREFPSVGSPVCALRLPNGNTLITCDGTVKEFAPDNKVVWQVVPSVDIPFINIGVPAGVQRLPNGNTLVCNWHSVANQNQDAVHVFEITPDKKIVWLMGTPTQEALLSSPFTYVSQGSWDVAQCQLLTDDGKARKELVLR